MLKKIWKKLLFAMILTGSLSPITAHADQGVMLKWHVAKGEHTGKLRQFNTGETIYFQDLGDRYKVEIEGDIYFLPKDVALKTVLEKELSYIVNAPGADLYENPSLFSHLIQKLDANEVLHASDENKPNDEWVKVKTASGKTGYVQRKDLTVKYESVPFVNKAYIANDVRADGVEFQRGEEIAITGFKDGKFAVKNGEKTVWIQKAYVSFEKPAPKAIKEKRMSKSNEKQNKNQHAVLSYAYELLGRPYRYGANGPYAYDCSSFTQTVFRKIGIYLPRTSQEQAKVGTRVSKNNLQPGDLLFFNTDGTGVSHVGIYIGNGKMIHAGGDRVHVTSIEKEYWQKRFLFAKRI